MNFGDSLSKIKAFLEKELIDPISKRASSWIYDDDVRIDLDKSAYPKILLRASETDLTKERLGLGHTSTIDTYPLSIEIKAKLGEHYGLGTDKYTDKQFVSYIASQIESLIKSSHDDFVDDGFLHIIPISSKPSRDTDKNPIFTLRLEVKYQN